MREKTRELSGNPSTNNSTTRHSTSHSATCNPSTDSSRLSTTSGGSWIDLGRNLTRLTANNVNGVERLWSMKKVAVSLAFGLKLSLTI